MQAFAKMASDYLVSLRALKFGKLDAVTGAAVDSIIVAVCAIAANEADKVIANLVKAK